MVIINKGTSSTNSATVTREVVRWQNDQLSHAIDTLIEEVPIALVYNGISHVVMMASPTHLADFALGFSLTENIIQSESELRDLDIVKNDKGIELHIQISPRRLSELKTHRRNLTGRTGCGLCGAESLEQAIRPLKPLKSKYQPTDQAIQNAVRQLERHQPLQAQTGACHGAAWCSTQGDIQLVREDIGRHNALDKLIGAIKQSAVNTDSGFTLVSSRASYEMVHKAATAGINSLVSVSAPTSLAVKLAEDANLSLVGFARPQRHVCYTNRFSENT